MTTDNLELHISGASKMPGGEYASVRISGSGKITGNLLCGTFSCSGAGKVEGDLVCRELAKSSELPAMTSATSAITPNTLPGVQPRRGRFAFSGTGAAFPAGEEAVSPVCRGAYQFFDSKELPLFIA